MSTPCRGTGHVSLSHLALVRRKRGKYLLLLLLGHLEGIKRATKFGGHLIELCGRNLELAMGFLQAKDCAPWSRRRKFEGSTRNVADPQGAHEFQSRQSAQIIRVPFAEGRVFRSLANDRVLHDRIAELINHGCDGKRASEPFVQTRLRHC